MRLERITLDALRIGKFEDVETEARVGIALGSSTSVAVGDRLRILVVEQTSIGKADCGSLVGMTFEAKQPA